MSDFWRKFIDSVGSALDYKPGPSHTYGSALWEQARRNARANPDATQWMSWNQEWADRQGRAWGHPEGAHMVGSDPAEMGVHAAARPDSVMFKFAAQSGIDPENANQMVAFVRARDQAAKSRPPIIRKTTVEDHLRIVYGDQYGDRMRALWPALSRTRPELSGTGIYDIYNPFSLRSKLTAPVFEVQIPAAGIERRYGQGNSGSKFVLGSAAPDSVTYATGSPMQMVQQHEFAHMPQARLNRDAADAPFFAPKPGDQFTEPGYRNSNVEVAANAAALSHMWHWLGNPPITSHDASKKFMEALLDQGGKLEPGPDPTAVLGPMQGQPLEGYKVGVESLGGQLRRASPEEREKFLRTVPLLPNKVQPKKTQVA